MNMEDGPCMCKPNWKLKVSALAHLLDYTIVHVIQTWVTSSR